MTQNLPKIRNLSSFLETKSFTNILSAFYQPLAAWSGDGLSSGGPGGTISFFLKTILTRLPGTKPRYQGTKPRYPGTKPRDPGTKPRYPGTKPRAPGGNKKIPWNKIPGTESSRTEFQEWKIPGMENSRTVNSRENINYFEKIPGQFSSRTEFSRIF